MKIKGTVKNGVVIMEGPVLPPEGTEVLIEFTDPSHPGAWIHKYAGVVTDLPSNASRSLDRDLYGPVP